jgi:hypothetical protein
MRVSVPLSPLALFNLAITTRKASVDYFDRISCMMPGEMMELNAIISGTQLWTSSNLLCSSLLSPPLPRPSISILRCQLITFSLGNQAN